MSRCVIVSAAKIENYKKLRPLLRPDDFFIFCDAGLSHAKKLKVTPDLIVGDFDSYKKPVRGKLSKIETITLPRAKDDTDTFYAVKQGLARGFKDFLLLGVMGQRFDHTMVNISALIYLKNHGAKAEIADDYSVMRLIGKETETVGQCEYFSLINVAGDARGVTIKNAKFPLENGTITAEYMYGSSNEALPGKSATVSVAEGTLLLVEVK